MQAEDMDDQRRELSVVSDDVQIFAQEIEECDEVLLSKYAFVLQDRQLTRDEARSFLGFVRSQLQAKNSAPERRHPSC